MSKIEAKPESTKVKTETVTSSTIESSKQKKKKKKQKSQNQNGSSTNTSLNVTVNSEKTISVKTETSQQESTIAKPKSLKRKLDQDTKLVPSKNQNVKKQKFNKLKGDRKSSKGEAVTNELSENRLKAFGINPKKFKNKIKYGGRRNQSDNKNQKRTVFK